MLFSKYILPVSVVAILFISVVLTNQVFAFGKPSGLEEHATATTVHTTHGDSSSHGTNRMYPQSISSQSSTASSSGEDQSEVATSSGESHHGQSHMPAFAQVHLQDAKLRVCQSHLSSVTTRSTHLVALVTHMEKTFTAIAEGVEQYYLTRVVPTGATLANYDQLVADITTQENAIAALVQNAQADATNFSCTANNPGAQLTQYRTDMQAVLSGLKDYRTSIKNLIVAVRTLPSVSVSTTPPVLVSPTEIPSVTLAPTTIPTDTPTVTVPVTDTPTLTPSVTP